MKIDINELKIRKATTKGSLKHFIKKYGDGTDIVSKKVFDQRMPYYAADIVTSILNKDDVVIAGAIFIRDTIYQVCVDEEYRNNGICKLLIKEMLLILRKKEFKGVIRISSRNPVAQKIYESFGFKTHKQIGDEIFYSLELKY